MFRTELWSANTHTVLFLALGTLINNQTFFFSIIPELMETFDFPSLSRKMPSQILGRGLENQPRDFRRRKTFFFFFHSKPSKLDKLHCTWSSNQDRRPQWCLVSGEQTCDSKNSMGWGFLSISETGISRMKYQNVGKEQKI